MRGEFAYLLVQIAGSHPRVPAAVEWRGVTYTLDRPTCRDAILAAPQRSLLEHRRRADDKIASVHAQFDL
jgi:hypothetical protein